MCDNVSISFYLSFCLPRWPSEPALILDYLFSVVRMNSKIIQVSNTYHENAVTKDQVMLSLHPTIIFEEEKNLILLQRIKNIIRIFVFEYIAAYYVKQSIENQKYTCLWILISEGFFIVPTPTVTLDLS